MSSLLSTQGNYERASLFDRVKPALVLTHVLTLESSEMQDYYLVIVQDSTSSRALLFSNRR
jgi:hypothetical protein